MDLGIIHSANSRLRQAGIELVKKDWETEILGMDVFRLNWHSENESLVNLQQEDLLTEALLDVQNILRSFSPCLISTRLSAYNQEARRALENAGFHLIECYLELEHDMERIPNQTTKNIIRPFQVDDIPVLEKIAYESFRFSRFHNCLFIR